MVTTLLLSFVLTFGDNQDPAKLQTKADSVENILSTLTVTHQLDTIKWLMTRYRFTDTRKAARFGRRALALASKQAPEYNITPFYSELAVDFTVLSEYDTAESYYDSALIAAKDDPNWLNKIYTNKAIMYSFQARYNEALKSHFKSLDYLETIQDEDSKMRNYNGIATIYKSTEDYAKSIRYYREALKIAATLKDRDAENTLLGNLANTLQIDGQTTEAKPINLKVVRYSEKNSPGSVTLGNNYYTMSLIYADLDQWDSSYYYAEKAVSIFRDRGVKRELGYSYPLLARAGFNTGKIKEAEETALKGYTMNKENGRLGDLEFNLFTLVKIYSYKHELNTANKYERELQKVKDSLQQENHAKAVLDVEAKYENDKKTHENELLKSEASLQRALLSRGRIILLSSIGGLVLVGILAIILFKSNRQRKRFNNMLQSENEKLKVEMLVAQLNQLKDQINPHFLFNSLATLQAMAQENDPNTGLFVHKLSEVYRYILQTNSDSLVSLKEELKVAEAYLFMLKARFEGALITRMDIPEELLSRKIPPFSLQLLIENATKHNAATHALPLHISILANGHELVVQNSLQPKRSVVESTKVGLVNLQKRYMLLGSKSISIEHGSQFFTVTLPLFN